jgi:hypothetical protein
VTHRGAPRSRAASPQQMETALRRLVGNLQQSGFGPWLSECPNAKDFEERVRLALVGAFERGVAACERLDDPFTVPPPT